MLTTLLLDLDDTILDFYLCEKNALKIALSEFGIEPVEDILSLYHIINKEEWEKLERGESTRSEITYNRFVRLVNQLSLHINAKELELCYEDNLSRQAVFVTGAEDAIKKYKDQYELILVSNGTTHIQDGRLNKSGLIPFFNKIYISESMGVVKPSKDYFDIVFSEIGEEKRETCVIIGDSITSDMAGSKNANIRAIWFHTKPQNKKCPYPLVGEASSWDEIDELLKTL